MHETTERLFRAAKALHRRTEPHQVAALMNISQQVLKNWESRGISDTGMLDAEERIGCSAIWIRTGRGDMCKGLLPHAREERATYHIQLDNKATYVIDGIRGFLHLGGFPPNCLGNTPTLKASLMTGTPPDMFSSATIRATLAEMWAEVEHEIPLLTADQFATLLIDKMTGWIDPQANPPSPPAPSESEQK